MATLIKGHSSHPSSNQLAEPALLGTDVGTLAFQREDREVPAGTLCTAAGWGLTTNTGKRPDRLQSVELSILSRATCNRRIHHDGEVTENMMCTEIKRDSRKDTCKGDSGGPLVCHGVAEGVVAAGSRVCGNWKKPGIYTRIPPYLEWIRAVMASAN
ncbi:complement factor D-like [Sceloporus undulatus]|uniref:complement factor D-like n=1 Tax=Sceloporus undulatus TaxID=8520 RepID=UPI001C4A85D8|nr:complement factor D-like [Sceloporus undulatus]